MALTVSTIRAWLNQFTDDTFIGIGEDEMTLQPADERYDEAYLEIGMALSSEYLTKIAPNYMARQQPPYVIPPPDIMEAQREAAIEDFDRAYPAAMKTALDTLRAQMAAAGIDIDEEYKKTTTDSLSLIRFLFPDKKPKAQTWECDECGTTNLPVGDHKSSCSRF